MNLMGNHAGIQIGMGLKYCERCGKLFLREITEDVIHCAVCKARLAALRSATELSGRGQKRALRKKPTPTILAGALGDKRSIACLRGVAINEERPC